VTELIAHLSSMVEVFVSTPAALRLLLIEQAQGCVAPGR
jgi:hypothetical protein